MTTQTTTGDSTMSFTAKDVMTLRQKTGLGMMDCKNALTETNGDATAAEEWIREKKKGKMDTRTERTTGEGRIAVAYGDGTAVIVEVQTETDFTAKNETFEKMVVEVANFALASSEFASQLVRMQILLAVFITAEAILVTTFTTMANALASFKLTMKLTQMP